MVYNLVQRCIILCKTTMNNLEKQVEKIIHKIGFKFTPQFKFQKYTLDFADEINKIAIEVQGTYWHGHILKEHNEQKKQKDKQKRTLLEKNGWKIIYVWEHSIKRNPQKIMEYLEKEILKGIII